MTMIWMVSLLCWSGAALLVAGLAFPDIFQIGPREQGSRETS
ncbi:MAG TPA: hypothetical protein VMW68_00575 [Methyloceanibacter sp.]|nr:hypothetical protein [Methyloceanibacter sp.]